MKSGKLIVFAILGVAVLVYVVYELTRAPSSSVRKRDAYARAEAEGGQEDGRRVLRPRSGPVESKERGSGEKKNVVRPIPAPPPPPPPPTMPPEQARAQFEEYLAELEQVKTEGRALETPEWTEFYRRGNEALEPLVRSLDSANPEQAKEVDAAHMKFRELIMELEPKPPGAAPP